MVVIAELCDGSGQLVQALHCVGEGLVATLPTIILLRGKMLWLVCISLKQSHSPWAMLNPGFRDRDSENGNKQIEEEEENAD